MSTQQRRTVGQIEIERDLGRGGMGVVRLGRQPGLDRLVVLKTLRRSLSEEPALAERFAARWTNSWPHVIISVPEALADQMPTRDEVLEAATEVYGRDLEPRDELRDLPDALLVRPQPVDPADSLEPRPSPAFAGLVLVVEDQDPVRRLAVRSFEMLGYERVGD